MTIDEAIKHCWDITAIACKRCADEHAQLATWLEELNEYQSIGTPEQCLEAVERTRWIPVSERLPEEEGRYLVTFRSERKAYLVGYGNCQMSLCGKKIGYGWYDLHDAVYFDEKSIVAWMPLPELYHTADASKKVGDGCD